jgi:hypothetical protein
MIQPIFKSPSENHYFFGYYDKSQLNRSSTRLLSLRVDFMDHIPNKKDRAVIGYFDMEADSQPFVEVADTRAFNWQQGCMLQWLGSDHETRVIYNDQEEGRFISVILDLETNERKVLPMPVYTVSFDGRIALCIDQERHHFCRRGYSYDGVVNQEKNQDIVPGDGVWLLDLDSGVSQQVIALEELLSIQPLSNMKGAVHYVEHLMLNPSGTRFSLLHRWKMPEGGIYSRFYTADSDGSDLYLLNDSGRMSHFCWRNDNEILAYGGLANPVNKLRRYKKLVRYFFKPLLPLYHKLVNDNSPLSKVLTGDSYILFTDKTKERKKVAQEISGEDGHPSFPPGNPDLFITDTYPDPDEGSIAKLLAYDLAAGESRVLTELDSISEYDNSPERCDLHPKCSYDGKYVSVDTMDRGGRGVYLYEFDKTR